MRPSLLTLLAALPIAACAGGSTGAANAPAPADAGLAYSMPALASVQYEKADSILVQIDAGGQFLDINIDERSLLDLTFSQSGDGVQVSATWAELDATASDPMSGSQKATAADVTGSLVWTLSPQGRGTIVSRPETTGTATQVVSPIGIANGFFPPLPARTVAPGDTWADTVSVSGEEDGGAVESTTVYTFTVAGEEVVDGLTVLRIDFITDDTRVASGDQGGMTVTQDVAGEGEGYFLWDPARRLVVEQKWEGRLSGAMSVDMMPMPLGMDMNVRTSMRLVSGGN